MFQRRRYGWEIAHRIQVMCYLRVWRWPRRWEWPHQGSSYREYRLGRPLFTGYCIGPFDIRVWHERIPAGRSSGGVGP